MEQLEFEIPKDKREIRVVIKLNRNDLKALEEGMSTVGEVNKSSYIRRLIHDAVRKTR